MLTVDLRLIMNLCWLLHVYVLVETCTAKTATRPHSQTPSPTRSLTRVSCDSDSSVPRDPKFSSLAFAVHSEDASVVRRHASDEFCPLNKFYTCIMASMTLSSEHGYAIDTIKRH